MLTENGWLAKKVGVMSKQRRIRRVLTAPAAARVLASGLRQGGERQKRSTYSTEDGSPPRNLVQSGRGSRYCTSHLGSECGDMWVGGDWSCLVVAFPLARGGVRIRGGTGDASQPPSFSLSWVDRIAKLKLKKAPVTWGLPPACSRVFVPIVAKA